MRWPFLDDHILSCKEEELGRNKSINKFIRPLTQTCNCYIENECFVYIRPKKLYLKKKDNYLRKRESFPYIKRIFAVVSLVAVSQNTREKHPPTNNEKMQKIKQQEEKDVEAVIWWLRRRWEPPLHEQD